MTGLIEEFRVAVGEEVLVDLRDRLARTRLPRTLDDVGWEDGTDAGYLRGLADYWRQDFDWRASEAQLNRLPQFTTTVNGLSLHFIHVRSPHPHAMPLLITHGWPGSVYEFHKIIGPLVDPPSYGGDAHDSFHVICPSIPGYGWSQAPTRRGFGVTQIAQGEIELMRRLGYEQYGLQGGDWGSSISATIAKLTPENVVGVHLNMVGFLPVPEGPDAERDLSPSEIADVAEMYAHRAEGSGYRILQATRPQTLSFALADSPVGLAAWIVEKFRAWSDCNGDIESAFTRDELLTNITIYWVTNTAGSSARLYRESRHPSWTGRVGVPVACAIFPKEMSRYPRRWVEPHLNVTRWTTMPRGGHFAALEQPDLLVADIGNFFRALR